MQRCKPQSRTAAEFRFATRDSAASYKLRNFSSTFAFWLCVVFGFFCFESTGFAWQRLAAVPNSQPSPQTPSRDSGVGSIELLDSPNFSQREIATANIIGEGASVLPVLTARFFQSSPETNYRIRKALEGIAASGDEETFLKSTAILLTLYSNGNDQIFQQIEELKVKWRAKRTGIAIAALKRSGAEVAQQKGYDNRFARQAIIARPKAPSQGGGRSEVKTEVRSVEQQKKMVETILNGDANSNRDFIFDSFPEKARVNQTLAVGVLNQNLPHLAGTTIKFPANWAAENSDADVLRELREIDDRLFVEFSGTDLTKPQWASLAAADNVVSLKLAAKQSTDVLPPTLPPSLQAMTLVGFDLEADFADVLGSCSQLSQLQLNNCRFSERAAERIDGVRTINSLVCQFEKFKMDGDLVRAMAEFGDLRALYFTAVEFEDAALVNLRRLSGVSLLYVSEIPATSKFFQNVGAMPALRSIQFKGCKLDIPAYKRLAAGSRVRMNFEAQAFLGIQGSGVNAGRLGSDTMVSMVIPDSAADEGGIQAGDFINKIDGEKVNDFNDVRLHITQYAAGDEVALEVLRDAKPVSLTVKLRDYQTARKR